jgi:hypothetical protein
MKKVFPISETFSEKIVVGLKRNKYIIKKIPRRGYLDKEG